MQEAPMHESRVPGPQGQLTAYHLGAGTGIPVVFLHADSGRAAQWGGVMAAVAADRQAIAFDFRGHGASEPAADGDYGYDGRAADLGAIADAFALRSFVVVAHSGASGAALAYAASHAHRVAGLLLVEPPPDPRARPQAVRDGFVAELAGPRSLEVQKAYFASIAGSDDAVRERVLTDAEAVDPAARIGVGAALAAWNPEPTLNAYGGPMLVLSTPATDTAAALYRLRPDVPHRVVMDTGHWLQLDQPAVVVAAIRDFVARVEAAAGPG
jgi:pimeloyl-ACP methyl ester carboxylesterase